MPAIVAPGTLIRWGPQPAQGANGGDLAERGTYLLIASELARRITEGEIRPGEMLPSEAALSKAFSVARGTARAALAVLESKGLARVVAGQGRVVAGEVPEDTEPTTAYERVARYLVEMVSAPDFDVIEPLPSEQQLMATHGVSRVTVRRAYDLLRSQGVVVIQQGSGAFVAPGFKRPRDP